MSLIAGKMHVIRPIKAEIKPLHGGPIPRLHVKKVYNNEVFFLSNRPVHNVPWAAMGQVQSKVQISAMPGCAYGLQLTAGPP